MPGKTPRKRSFPEKSTHSIVKESIAKESKEKNILRERECACTRENWDDWKNELLNDEDWRASVVRQSGQGIAFNSRLPQLLDDFCDFLISIGETETAKEKKDFVRRFAYWCKNLCHEEKKMIIRQNRKAEPVSRIEELKRVGEESLAIARQMLLGDGFRI